MFQIFECVHISTPLLNRTRACPTIMATDHRPSLWIFQARWFNPTMDRSAGQCPGQMHYRRQTAAKRGWLQSRGGGMDPPPSTLLKAWVVPFHAATLPRRVFFRREWPLSAKFARFPSRVLIDPLQTTGRDYEWYMSRDRIGNSRQEMRAIFFLDAFSRFSLLLPLSFFSFNRTFIMFAIIIVNLIQGFSFFLWIYIVFSFARRIFGSFQICIRIGVR